MVREKSVTEQSAWKLGRRGMTTGEPGGRLVYSALLTSHSDFCTTWKPRTPMGTFLQIIGAIVLGLIGLFVLLMVIGYFFLRRKMSQLGNSMTDLMEAADAISQTVPPFRIRLEPANHRDWIHADEFDVLREELDSRGCVRIGRFTSVPPTVLLEAWHHPKQNFFVTIYEHPVGGLWCEAGYELDDDSLFAYSNGPNHHMGNPPWTTFEFRTGVEPGELLDAIIADRPDQPVRPTSAESFVARFEAAWARDMDWRIARGGPSDEEIQTTIESGLAEESGSENEASLALTAADSFSLVEQIRGMWRDRINEFLETQLRESWIVSSGVSALDWDRIRDRVIFIHDGLTADDLAEHLEQYLYTGLGTDEKFEVDDDEYDRLRSELDVQLKTQSARSVFTESVANQTTSTRHERIGGTAEPVESDVWISPELAGDSDY